MKTFTCENGHEVKVVEARKDSNGALSVRLQCCDAPHTDHWHTMYVLHTKTAEEIDASIASIAEGVSVQHESHDAAHQYIVENLLHETEPPPPKGTMELK